MLIYNNHVSTMIATFNEKYEPIFFAGMSKDSKGTYGRYDKHTCVQIIYKIKRRQI